jgi:cell division protein FtsQ
MATKEQERKKTPQRRQAPPRRTPGAKQPVQQAAPQQRKPAQEVVYTPPKPFNRKRMMLRLATVAAVVIALVLGISVFFKVETVEVSGCSQYSAWSIREASGIEDGENLLTLSRGKAAGKIIAAFPYIDSVRIGIKLPGTVTIEVTEVRVTYRLEDENGKLWLVSSSGKVVAETTLAESEGFTKILGVKLDDPKVGEQAVALEISGDRVDSEGNVIPVTVTQAQRLQAALDIATYLEDNEIIGKAANIDVSDLGNISLWYGDRYQVLLGDTTQLSYKIKLMRNTIESGKVTSGVLDITLTVQKDGVICKDFT